MPKPDFIVPGFQKGGTTAVRFILRTQFSDEVYMPNCLHPDCLHRAEYGFWFPPYPIHEQGVEWYYEEFKEGMVNGEKSPQYCHKPDIVFTLMKEHIPDCKFIFCVRNPVTRAFSAWNHYVTIWPKSKEYGIFDPKKSFYDNLLDPELQQCFLFAGCYNWAINRILIHYPMEQMHFVVQERLASKNKEIMQEEWDKIADFLGVTKRRVYQSYIHDRHYPEPMSSPARDFLNGYYYQHNQRFFKTIGMEIPEWKN